MKRTFLAVVLAGLAIPTTASSLGQSVDKRQDIGFPFETQGECQRAAQRSNSAARKNGESIRYECVEENGTFIVRPVGTTSPS